MSDYEDIDADIPTPRRDPRLSNGPGLILLFGGIFVLVAISATVLIYRLAQDDPKPTVKAESPPVPRPVVPVKPLVKPKEKADPPPIVRAVETPIASPKKGESVADLLEKGRRQYRDGDRVLAEQTWLKAIELCGPDATDQKIKAELYYRIGWIREIEAGTFQNPATLAHYDRYYEILGKQGVAAGDASIATVRLMSDMYQLHNAK